MQDSTKNFSGSLLSGEQRVRRLAALESNIPDTENFNFENEMWKAEGENPKMKMNMKISYFENDNERQIFDEVSKPKF